MLASSQPTLQSNMKVAIPGMHLPSFRVAYAEQAGCNQNLLLTTWGGLGDQICAEPTLRFALENFKNQRISLVAQHPEFFQHLKFESILEPQAEDEQESLLDKFLVLNTAVPSEWLHSQFFSHMATQCVDHPAMAAFRMMLPVDYRAVKLCPTVEQMRSMRNKVYLGDLETSRPVVIHAGRHWQSKTFPKYWWDKVISTLHLLRCVPVLIGQESSDGDFRRGTIDVNAEFCIDLRGKFSLMETVAFLQGAKVVLTNDSSPLHMAVTGNAWIGFLATAKHPDYITHWRKHGNRTVWGWRMENLSLGGCWQDRPACPNTTAGVHYKEATTAELERWLPDPKTVAIWAAERLRGE